MYSLHARVAGVVRRREKACQAREHQRRRRPGEQKTHLHVEMVPQEAGHGLVESGEWHEQPHGQHGAGECIAERGHAHTEARHRAGTHPLRRYQPKRNAGGKHGGDAGDAKARLHEVEEAAAQERIADGNGITCQHREGHCEPKHHRCEANRRCQHRAATLELLPGRWRTARDGIVEPPPASVMLCHHQHSDEQEQESGKLHGGITVAEREPGAEDAGSEGGDAEIVHHAVVGDGFHERERQPSGNGGPRGRQGDAVEGTARRCPEHPRRLEHRRRLRREGGSGEEIDIGVENQSEHDGGAAKRAHRRKEIVARLPAGDVTQRGLHGAGIFEQVRIDIRHHIGRRRQRQRQRPSQPAPPRKLLRGHHPRRADANHSGQHPNAQHQQRGVGEVVRQHRGAQVRPRLARRQEQ